MGVAFDALADPTRRNILCMLTDGAECSAGEIATQAPAVTRTTVSAHLRILRTAGLVNERRAGRNRYYSLDADGPAGTVMTTLDRIFGSASPAPEPSGPGPAARERGDRP
ncbi:MULTISPECIES: ArsR/SmtB family transcription factor [Pseudonocardia]|uniref:Transcriptional repressor SdpR n=1 Tax=Pseudonocardia autotrophica TaxID=2074 RepID=A0A1Y2MMA0_PSEAH|nr:MULTISPECIES: metalloregulator ArsR/SmtB family transcription factor [Pseudonocardia]OSY35588.1 Transcriptional repressor SdpR [Pseudonocardia autotrophica]TDN76879.1 DNA-binding transcriptional ArsR family regulator [Pseudonocardia autotrophica]